MSSQTRVEDTYNDSTLSSKRAERISELRTPTVEGELMHYNSKYGTTLTDSQAAAADKQQSEFQSKVNSENQKIRDASSIINSQYNSEYNRLSNYNINQDYENKKNEWVKVVVGTTKEMRGDIYYMPKEVVDSLSKSGQVITNYFEVLPGQITSRSQWTTNPGTSQETPGVSDPSRQNYLVVSPVLPQGQSGTMYWDETVSAISDLHNQIKDKYISATNDKIQEGLGTLTRGYGDASKILINQQNQIDSSVNQNNQVLNSIRIKYQQKLSNVKDTIGKLVHG